MAKTLIVSADNVNSAAAVDVYSRPGQGMSSTHTATEANHQITWETAGTIDTLRVMIETNTLIVGGINATSRKNLANGNLTVTIGLGVTGALSDLTHSDSLAVGDEFNYKLTADAVGGGVVVRHRSVGFTPTSNSITSMRMACISSATSFSTASTTRYSHLSGTGSRVAEDPYPATDESLVKTRNLTVATLKNFFGRISANTRVTDTTFTDRINGAGGTLLLTVGAAATGFFEDLTHSDTLAVNDDINVAYTTDTGAGSITIQGVAADYETSTNKSLLSEGIDSGRDTDSATLGTLWWEVAGGVDYSNVINETGALTLATVDATISTLTIKVSTNSANGTTTMDFFKNSIQSAMGVSIGATTSGLFQDAVDSVPVRPTDLINLKSIIGGTGTTRWTSFTMLQDSSVAPAAPRSQIGNRMSFSQG